jgi:hypothetical protein
MTVVAFVDDDRPNKYIWVTGNFAHANSNSKLIQSRSDWNWLNLEFPKFGSQANPIPESSGFV